MGAPGLAVPTVPKHGGGVRFADGTSFATPQVTSLAAILKSLNPGLSPSQLIDYMLTETLPTTAELGAARLTFTVPIQYLLLDVGVEDPVRSWIDPLDLGNPGPTGLLLSRICPTGMTFHVEEYGTFQASEQLNEEHMVRGLMDSVQLTIDGLTESEEFALGTGPIGFSLRLGEYPILPDTSDHPLPPGAVSAVFYANDRQDAGQGLFGTMILESCEVVERDPFNGVLPFHVHVSGAFEGVMEVQHLDGSDPTIHDFDGFFTDVPLFTGMAGPDDQIVDEIESLCEGGRGGDAPAEGEVGDEDE
jgi:hypothetical protein